MVKKRLLYLQLGLFLLTFITTTFAGSEWVWGRFLFWGKTTMNWGDFLYGFQFSFPFLLILTCHELGHYFTAKYHQIKVTLPFYIPMWWGFLLPIPSLGTMGAFIRIKEAIHSRSHFFDLGISGPLAGFVIAVLVLWYGFNQLPPTEYIYEVHPEYELFGDHFEEKMESIDTLVYKKDLNSSRYNYVALPDSIALSSQIGFYFGDNLLMKIFRQYLAPQDRYVPSAKEIMHYPWILAGYLALIFTAINLLPMGQLDGGHVIFGLFGMKWHRRISHVLFIIFMFYAGLGWVQIQDLPDNSTEAFIGFFIQMGIYLYLLYLSTHTLIKNKKDRLMFISLLFLVQFLLASFFDIQGYEGWLLFGVLIGRFLGLQHPEVVDHAPLTVTRKILGWLALVIFVFCFTPEPMVIIQE